MTVPVASNLDQTLTFTEDAATVALGDIVVADKSSDVMAFLQLDQPGAGSLTTGTYGGVTSTYNASNGLWAAQGPVDDVNAALAAVSFVPAANWDQDVEIKTFILYVDLDEDGEGTITLNATPVNDAPVLGQADTALDGTDEHTASEPVTVAELLAALQWSDPDAGASGGAALVGTTGAGTWQYSVNGDDWSDVGTVSSTAALLLTPTTYLRYQPDGKNGETATLQLRAWDQTAGTATTDAARGTADASTGGGSSAFSATSGTVELAVTGVNDAPVLGQADMALDPTDEDTSSDPVTVAELLAALQWSDPDTGALGGAALVGTTGAGTWQYSVNGDDWSDVGTVSSTAALLLTSTTYLRYQPDGKNGETATLQLRAWDQTAGTATTDAARGTADASTGGGSSAFSATSGTVELAVTGVNDAPTLTAVGGSLGTVNDQTPTTAATVSSLLATEGVADVDDGALDAGMAVVSATGPGSWQYSLDGTTWTDFGTVSESAALLLSPTTQVRFAPDGTGGGAIDLEYRVWDRSTGSPSAAGAPVTADTTANGGTSAFSSATSFVGGLVTVNNPPTGSVTVSGAAEVGATLTASNTLADADGLGTISYQWQADGADIIGATGSTLVLTSDHLGKAIRVVASYTDSNGTSESVPSAQTALVAAPSPSPSPEPDPGPPPSPPPVTELIDGVPVQVTTRTEADGTTTRQYDIPVVTPELLEQLGVDGVRLQIRAATTEAASLLELQIPGGSGLSISGLDNPVDRQALIAAIVRSATNFGGTEKVFDDLSRALLASPMEPVGPAKPYIFQGVTLTGGATRPSQPLFVQGTGNGEFGITMFLDARAAAGSTIQLDNVDFAALIGRMQVQGGTGPQVVVGDGAPQIIFLGEGDDLLRGGDGDDTVGSGTGADSLFGDGGNDVVTGGEGADQVWGGEGDDFVHGNQDADFVHGGQGNDTLHGGQGDDVVRGGQGDDIARGDLGNDTVFGDFGADTVSGGAGDDVLWGGAGLVAGPDLGDRIDGGEGSDFVHGNQGNDTLLGGAGDDLVQGGQGDDVLDGGDGDDTLSGDLGDDVLSGGAGADRFLVFANGGHDRVLDFDGAAGDRIVLGAGLTYTLRQAGADAVIDLGGGASVTLQNVQASSLADGWIIGG